MKDKMWTGYYSVNHGRYFSWTSLKLMSEKETPKEFHYYSWPVLDTCSFYVCFLNKWRTELVCFS